MNVCIYRLPLGQSVVWPASALHVVRPLARRGSKTFRSSAFSCCGGRCRSCGAPISIRYPIVESLTGRAVRRRRGSGITVRALLLASRLVFGCALIVLFAIDLEHHLLPNVITLPGIIVGFAFSLFGDPGWLSSLIGIVAGGGVLWAIAEGYYRLRHEEGLGMGDVKMLAMIGAFLGWKLTLVTLMMASFSGSIVGLALIAIKARREIRAAVRHLPRDRRRAAAATVGPARCSAGGRLLTVRCRVVAVRSRG